MKKFIFNHTQNEFCDGIGYTKEELDAIKDKAEGLVMDFVSDLQSTQSMMVEKIQKEMTPEETIILAAQYMKGLVFKEVSQIAMKQAFGDFLIEKSGNTNEERKDPLTALFDMMAKDIENGEIIPEAKA